MAVVPPLPDLKPGEEVNLKAPITKGVTAKLMVGLEVVIDYTNHKGVAGKRRIRPQSITFRSSVWHKEPQWLLLAKDLDKDAPREFALKDIHAWRPV